MTENDITRKKPVPDPVGMGRIPWTPIMKKGISPLKVLLKMKAIWVPCNILPDRIWQHAAKKGDMSQSFGPGCCIEFSYCFWIHPDGTRVYDIRTNGRHGCLPGY